MPSSGWITLAVAAVAAAAAPLVMAAANATSSTKLPVGRARGSAAVAVALAATAALLTSQRGPSLAATYAPLLLIGAAAAVVDARELRLPDPLTALLLCLALLGVGVHSVVHGDGPAATRAVAGMLIALGALAIGKLLRPAAIGWGDIKLAPSLGAYLGWSSWQALYVGMLLWWLLILLVAVARAARSRTGDDPIPYGPAMIFGTVLGIALT